MKQALFVLAGVLILVVVVAAAGISTYNRLVTLDQSVDQQWAQVENVYQRRLDLVPNLVETVRGAANFERDTFIQVAEARSRAQAVTGGGAQAAAGDEHATEDPAAMAQFQAAQDQLSSALGRLFVVVERYPELSATQNFRDLQAQLEGTENRIAVERMRYNEAAREFNTTRNRFPTTLIADMFGDRFDEKMYFRATVGADRPPAVQF
ncbi:LemA family protein [Polyangium jinanense]|uniref:LemA family protein n=1 Tax=Polyangium jinanense TaxID=2829994 RepID=A0A9X3X5K4_9BACT|nr:LemA family protein [Polyangium jinanense]MDC3957336.1 LemA family protein [Polyangium jinanense]MDC3982738.1 LemA family protein [Polyangium jinanense]